jgi:anti-sigma regulatory factor (Ser/Thr protein kinase)
MSLMPLIDPPADVLLALPPEAAAVGTARRALSSHGLGEDVEHTVGLLTSELVSNAVRHAASEARIVFHARLSGDLVRVEVADRGAGFDPEVRRGSSGYGLRMVDKLASRWGVERTASGCRVWFEVDRRSGRFARDNVGA